MPLKPLAAFKVGSLYSNEEIFKSLGVGNAGGIRPSVTPDGILRRLVIFTTSPAAKIARENPYSDRMEGDVLVYTAAGREGTQGLAGVNSRIPDQPKSQFPIYCFRNTASRRNKGVSSKRWEFLGLFGYQRHFEEMQIDSRGQPRKAWVFELRRLLVGELIPIEKERPLFLAGLQDAQSEPTFDNSPVVPSVAEPSIAAAASIEEVRRKMLSMPPHDFEHLVKRALEGSGFEQVEVTRYSQDGGIDVEAQTGSGLWPLRGTLLQVQAKRWIHTVGRREVAELRGSLKNFARGAFVTTSLYSKSAVVEATSVTKSPIVLVDGREFAGIAKRLRLLC
ncbi:MAG: restriction endonuclease [Verrucomicrobiales bacterium]|nr:restriction endonuclease [Verrucomicrobiales bacterium]